MMSNVRISVLFVSALAALTAGACQSNSGSTEGGTGTASVANNGIQGTYTGTMLKGEEEIADHAVTVMTDGDGAPQIGFWEFCNVDMVGAGPAFISAPDSSCLVDLGDGRSPYPVTAGATFTENGVTATVSFGDGDVTWSFTGTR